jgi:hypothetical protein
MVIICHFIPRDIPVELLVNITTYSGFAYFDTWWLAPIQKLTYLKKVSFKQHFGFCLVIMIRNNEFFFLFFATRTMSFHTVNKRPTNHRKFQCISTLSHSYMFRRIRGAIFREFSMSLLNCCPIQQFAQFSSIISLLHVSVHQRRPLMGVGYEPGVVVYIRTGSFI